MLNASLLASLSAAELRDRLRCESTVLHVFKLIWPDACIDCSANADCYMVGVSKGSLRHVVRVPCGLVELDQGLTLVRAVYKSGIATALCCKDASISVSL